MLSTISLLLLGPVAALVPQEVPARPVAEASVGEASVGDAPLLEQRVLFAGTLGAERTRHFVDLLDDHFVHVGTADYSDFDPALAEGYDVVVFDAEVAPSETSIGLPSARPELPEDWDRPSVLIGSGGILIAEEVGSKLDWL